jgi:hypothetical protein
MSVKSGHEGWHNGGRVPIACVHHLPTLKSKPPESGHRQSQCPGQSQAALIGNEVHYSQVKLGGVQLVEQCPVLQDHLAVHVGHAVDISRQGEWGVCLVPDYWALE